MSINMITSPYNNETEMGILLQMLLYDLACLLSQDYTPVFDT